MKGDIVTLKGEEAVVVAEVAVSAGTGNRTVIVYLYKLTKAPTDIYVVARNSFAQGTFGDKERAVLFFMGAIEDEAIS